MPLLRTLSDAGVQQFREFLQRIRAGEEFQQSPAILWVDGYSRPLGITISIEPRRFVTKFAAAEYLHAALEPLASPALASDTGLWSWLALFYFDQLSPLGTDGRRTPREDYHY
ncbi:MAG TPA: hypothetical protein VEZ11_12730, partial [Thermoanaerobaculia bacterium]|nr:hypothetical protein [Thermoanaerobaculia bacterium]